LHKRLRLLLPLSIGYAFFGWLHATQIYIGIRSEGGGLRFSYGRFATSEIACWLLWAVITPFIVTLSRRVPLALQPRPIALHAGAAISVGLLRTAGVVMLGLLIRPWGPMKGTLDTLYIGALTSEFHFDLIIYWAIVGVVHAFDSRQRLRERDLHTAQVETQLAQARLANLALQLQPHFLFNTLHSIASLVREGEPEPAVHMIAGLSDLLRYSLDNAGRHLVPLSEELDVVGRYLEIQQTRFSDRLAVTIDMPPDTRDAAVPTLLLQPLVENAVRHGMSVMDGAVKLQVRARREGASLLLEVLDDGASLAAGWQRRQGVGLSSTRARLHELYGAAGVLEVENLHPAGVAARVRIPYSQELG
jgi:LytS/YehU family sensor histidine kinase